MAEGSRRQLGFVAEVEGTPGVTPATGWQILRAAGDGSITNAKQMINSNELRPDRGVGIIRHGNSAPQMNLPFEFSYGTYDSLLESALQGAWADDVLAQGVTKKYHSFEEGFLDMETPQYIVLAGGLVSGMDLNIAPNAMVTGSFRIAGLSVSDFSGSPTQVAALAVQTTTQPFDSFTGTIDEGGAEIAIITSLTLSLDNGSDPKYRLLQSGPDRIATGRANLTGTVSAFFDDAALATKFQDETESSIELTLEDLDGNSYIITIPKLKYTGATREVSENQIMLNMPFQAYFDSVTETTIQIERVDVVV